MTPLLHDPFLAEPFRLMNEVFGRALGNGKTVTGWIPMVDVRETEEEYIVFVDVPGVKSEDVTIELVDQLLTISGTRVPNDAGTAQRLERPYGSFVRSLTLPKGIDADTIEADYADGVLTLHVPKPVEAKPKKIAIGGGSQKAIEQ